MGRLLARRLNTYFIDTDLLIENFENRSIREIFETEGEQKFRELERECFNWIKRAVTSTIISVGGGFPIYIPEIREAGVVIYLHVPWEEIIKRLQKKEEREGRPLFQDIKAAEELYRKREPIYRQLAHFTIENREIEESLEKVLEIVERRAN